MRQDPGLIWHASTVAVRRAGRDAVEKPWQALVVTGASGRGKSDFCLALMAFGARLVADDRTLLRRQGETLLAGAPPGLPAMIEARGLGLLSAPLLPQAPVAAILDLDVEEEHRLPPWRTRSVLGVDVALLHNSASQHFAAAVLHYLVHRRKD